MKYTTFLVAVLFLIGCKSNNTEQQIDAPQTPIVASKNGSLFTASFSEVVNSYYQLKDAFVAEDTIAVAAASSKLAKAIDSLQFNDFVAEEPILANAKSNKQNLADELKGLIAEPKIDNKRQAFHMISNDLYDLIRTVKYDAAKVYWQHCPMAFDNKGADWLNATSTIKNPYMPKKMLGCGENLDSVDNRSKK
jgi:Protein of unknown function (DUF3347)